MDKLLHNRAKAIPHKTDSYVEKDPIIKVFNKYKCLDRLIMRPPHYLKRDEPLEEMWIAIKEYCRMKGYKAVLDLEEW